MSVNGWLLFLSKEYHLRGIFAVLYGNINAQILNFKDEQTTYFIYSLME